MRSNVAWRRPSAPAAAVSADVGPRRNAPSDDSYTGAKTKSPAVEAGLREDCSASGLLLRCGRVAAGGGLALLRLVAVALGLMGLGRSRRRGVRRRSGGVGGEHRARGKHQQGDNRDELLEHRSAPSVKDNGLKSALIMDWNRGLRFQDDYNVMFSA